MNTILRKVGVSLLAFWATSIFAAPIVTHVSAGYGHCLFVESDGSLWGMGENNDGQLGLGTNVTGTSIPVMIVSSNVTTVAAGSFHSLFVKSDGSLWSMGDNTDGELGDGTFTNHFTPEEVVSTGVSTTSAGDNDSFFRTSAGRPPIETVSLWAMGFDNFGELGDNRGQDSPTQEVIQTTQSILNEVTTIAAGSIHTLFLRFNGSLWGMGDNSFGELGTNTDMDSFTPEQLVAGDVTSIAAGQYYSFFVKSDNTLWAMGYNQDGQLGDRSRTNHLTAEQVASNVVAAAAGTEHSLFIKTDGSLWATGDGEFGELGRGFDVPTDSPIQVVPSNVVAVAASELNSYFIKSDGSLWGMGNNSFGQLGDGTDDLFISKFSPVRIVPPAPSQVITGISVSGNNVILSGTNGMMGGTYYTLTSTDMTLSVDQWTGVSTNILSGDGNFTIIATNAVYHAARQQLFIVQLLN